MRKTHIERRNISLLKDEMVSKWIAQKVIELVDIVHICGDIIRMVF